VAGAGNNGPGGVGDGAGLATTCVVAMRAQRIVATLKRMVVVK
jgi:hypothetical protein